MKSTSDYGANTFGYMGYKSCASIEGATSEKMKDQMHKDFHPEIQSAAVNGDMRENENVRWWIGSMYATDHWFNGMIDEVCIWSEALSPREIQQPMEGELVGAAVSSGGMLSTTWVLIKNQPPQDCQVVHK